MSLRREQYQNVLKERGLPQDITNLVSQYAPYEDLRSDFNNLIYELYEDCIPSRFVHLENKDFDDMIQTLYRIMGTTSLQDYIKNNFWKLFYPRKTRHTPDIDTDEDSTDEDTLENDIKEQIFWMVQYELRGNLYDKFFNPNVKEKSYFRSKDSDVQDIYYDFFYYLLSSMFQNEGLSQDETFDDFLTYNKVNEELGNYEEWIDDKERLKEAMETLGMKKTSPQKMYNRLREYHQEMLSNLQ